MASCLTKMELSEVLLEIVGNMGHTTLLILFARKASKGLSLMNDPSTTGRKLKIPKKEAREIALFAVFKTSADTSLRQVT